MADVSREPDAGGEADEPAGAPRWVKVFGVIAVVLLVLLAIMLLSGGNHGPGRHLGSSGLGTTGSLIAIA